MSEFPISPLPAPQMQTATDQVFHALYDAVVSLELPPGTKVSEVEIAKQLDVSRQPVRDAFFRLSKLGFVAIRPQRATLVTKISERAVLHAAFVRTAIEVECLRVAITKVGGAEIARLREILDWQDATLSEPDPSAFHACDDAFHAAICGIAGEPHAWVLIQEQKAQMDRARWLTLSEDRRKKVLVEHSAVVDAVEAGNFGAAEERLRLHLANIHVILDHIREAHAEFFESQE